MSTARTVPALAAAALVAACQTTPLIPASLQPEPALSYAGTLHAVGVQVYQCRAPVQAGAVHAWAFVAPEAELYGPARQPAGKHYGGPHWEAPDGSKVVGVLKARADAPTSETIPWLLLGTRSVGPAGRFSRVQAIQRVNTHGGSIPRQACDAANAGQLARVPYTADYRLFEAVRGS